MGVLVRPFGVEDMADDEVDEQQRVCCCQQSPLGGENIWTRFLCRVDPSLPLFGGQLTWFAPSMEGREAKYTCQFLGVAWCGMISFGISIRMCRSYSEAGGCECP